MTYELRFKTGEVFTLGDASLTDDQELALLDGAAQLLRVDERGQRAVVLDVDDITEVSPRGLAFADGTVGSAGAWPEPSGGTESLDAADGTAGAPAEMNTAPPTAGLEQPPLREYMLPMSSKQPCYTTEGPLRGRCGHKHRDLESAVDCLDAEEQRCVALGGHTDRRVVFMAPGVKRALNEEELTAVARYRLLPPGDAQT